MKTSKDSRPMGSREHFLNTNMFLIAEKKFRITQVPGAWVGLQITAGFLFSLPRCLDKLESGLIV